MGIGHLLDHKARLWRRVESLGSHRQTEISYTLLYEEVPIADDGQRSVMSNQGGGVTFVGVRDIYADVGIDIRHRDVLEIYEGPNGPIDPTQPLQIESITPFRGHHLELRGTEFKGSLPNLDS